MVAYEIVFSHLEMIAVDERYSGCHPSPLQDNDSTRSFVILMPMMTR